MLLTAYVVAALALASSPVAAKKPNLVFLLGDEVCRPFLAALAAPFPFPLAGCRWRAYNQTSSRASAIREGVTLDHNHTHPPAGLTLPVIHRSAGTMSGGTPPSR